MMPKTAGTAPGKPLSRCTSIAHYVILARQITFRNKIPTAGVLRRPVLITSFDEAVRNNGRKPSTFKVAVNRVGYWNVGLV
jgi:hypothetical protein